MLSTWLLSLRRGGAGVWWGSSRRSSAGLLLVEIVVVRHLIKNKELVNYSHERSNSIMQFYA